MTPKQILAATGATIVAVGIGIVATQRSTSSTPVVSMTIETGRCQQPANSSAQMIYTGNFALEGWAFGWIGGDMVANVKRFKNGLYKVNAVTCTGAMEFVGDCWQSVTDLAGSPNIAKWLIANGAPDLCYTPGSPADRDHVRGLQVWLVNAGATDFNWRGLIRDDYVSRLGTPRLDGDVAWVKRNDGQWSRFDLNAMTVSCSAPKPRHDASCVSIGYPEPTTPPIQTSIQDYTYTIDAVIPPTVPPGWGGPHTWKFERQGGGTTTPSPTVPPTVTATPVPASSPTKTKTPLPSVTPTKTPCRVCIPCTPTKTPHFGPNA